MLLSLRPYVSAVNDDGNKRKTTTKQKFFSALLYVMNTSS